jgi:hypothetical protein
MSKGGAKARHSVRNWRFCVPHTAHAPRIETARTLNITNLLGKLPRNVSDHENPLCFQGEIDYAGAQADAEPRSRGVGARTGAVVERAVSDTVSRKPTVVRPRRPSPKGPCQPRLRPRRPEQGAARARGGASGGDAGGARARPDPRQAHPSPGGPRAPRSGANPRGKRRQGWKRLAARKTLTGRETCLSFLFAVG